MLWIACLAMTSVLSACNNPTESIPRQDYEVWLVDQSDSPGTTFGGTLYIYDGADLEGDGASSALPSATIDLAQETAVLCMTSTGANPVRPHVLTFNAAHTHAVLAFVASGHVAIFDAATRAPVGCVRTSAGAGGARQAHAAQPSPDGSYILVANQNGKLLERIESNFATNTFTLNAAATLNLASCTTPSGVACQLADVRPDNAPIFPIITQSGNSAFITLRGGGMFVVDPKTAPMAIRAEYDRATVSVHGLGGIETAGSMFVNSGGGTPAHLHGFSVYEFPTSFGATNPPNQPAPAVLFSDHSTPQRDSHGMVAPQGSRYLWVADRAANVIEIFDAVSNARVTSLNLAGALSSDPSPDLMDVSPSGELVFVSLRGPRPLSGDPHASTGNTPGLGIVRVGQDGKSGSLTGAIRISNADAGGEERADAHALRVRRY